MESTIKVTLRIYFINILYLKLLSYKNVSFHSVLSF